MTADSEKVFVGLSGGVDSGVAAKRLIEKGHDVVGVFIKVWQPPFLECDWEKERLDAMRVAAHLGIPFITFDAEGAYKAEVADYMINEYREGRTPNPDVMCNQHVKFGAFLKFARENGADKVATGHYAQVREEGGIFKLFRGVDPEKDQSYFLWTLTQEELRYIYMPNGDTTKAKIRKEAKKAGIPNFNKKDSQGICFLGQVDLKDFLSHYIDLKEGIVLSTGGEDIGTHDGAFLYTVGQRHGFSITDHNTESKPLYVQSKNIEENTITVSEERIAVERENKIKVSKIQKTYGDQFPKQFSAQFRYRQKPFEVKFTAHKEANGMIEVLETVEKPSIGQSCVFYDDCECLGGGIITY